MNINNRKIWQVAAGDGERAYHDLLIAHLRQKPLLRPVANPATPHAATVVQNTPNNPVP